MVLCSCELSPDVGASAALVTDSLVAWHCTPVGWCQTKVLCLLTALHFHVAGSGADEAALTQLQQQVAELQSANAELKEEADSSWAELNAKEEVSQLGASLSVQVAACATYGCPLCDTSLCDRPSAHAVAGSHTCCCM